MEELELATLGGQLKYVSICALHIDFERMAYQLFHPGRCACSLSFSSIIAGVQRFPLRAVNHRDLLLQIGS
jgi:hypothetical protein